ncbi:creatininase family protein [Bacteroidota bacterium]
MKKLTILGVLTALIFTSCTKPTMNEHLLYEELTPTEFRERIAEAPIAYLPLGTIEWHGEHLPLGSDGMQSREFFKELAKETGGIVFPMLFLGPDNKVEQEDGSVLYGMDRGNFIDDPAQAYEPRQFDGSCYWIPDTLFYQLIDAAMLQISRAGFKIVVAHGHGPSTNQVREYAPDLEMKYNLKILNCWGGDAGEGMGIMVDHAAMNETSLMMAFYPELVHMEYLPEDNWPAGVGGKDPREFASAELGKEIIKNEKERMVKLIKEELEVLGK